MMQQQADMCPILLWVIQDELDRCEQGAVNLLGEQQKCLQADLQPIVLKKSARISCNCRTSPAAANSQGGLQADPSANEYDLPDDLPQIDRWQHLMENLIASLNTESMASRIVKIKTFRKHVLPYVLPWGNTEQEHQDANRKIFDSR